MAGVEVLGYDAETAAWHARLLAHSRAAGLVPGAHGLIIAAHAAQTGRLPVSAHAKAAFAALPGVRVRQVRPGA
ncbi:MAG: hypothetical protein LBG60_14290 [Bifidobacteriaceae bacterium]|nr:hypothetical protein [Bifidobacteriaceae bacterium]